MVHSRDGSFCRTNRRDTTMKKFKFTIWDTLVFCVLASLAWGKSAQTILLAVVAFLLYLLVRWNVSKSSASAVALSDDNEFVIHSDDISSARIELERDINYAPTRNHYRFKSRYDTGRRTAEFEYKIKGTSVFVRLLHDRFSDIGVGETWEVRDGVFLETDYRERSKNLNAALTRNIEEDIADRKKHVEWHELLPSYGNGLKYFILYKNLSRDDARRYLRQEIERLKLGSNRFMEEAAKIGFIHDETSRWRLRLPDGVDPSQEERQKLSDSISSFDISYDEFTMAPGLIAAMEKYVA